MRLRSVEREDLPLLLAWRADREVMQYLPSAPMSPTWEEQLAWWKTVTHRRTWMLDIWDSDNGMRPVGEVHVDTETHEVGLLIGEKSSWGKGLGHVALMALLQRMVDLNISLLTLWAAIHPENTRSQRLFASVGFVKTGVLARNGQEEWRVQGQVG